MKIPTLTSGYLYAGIAVITAASLWGVYSLGSTNGKQSVYVEWQAQQVKDLKAMEDLRNEFAGRQAQYFVELAHAEKELRNAQSNYQTELNRLASQYDDRLRKSEDRANVYQRQANGSASERERLASHAAKLDRSLEEGRRLVAELSSTIRIRDEELKILSAQIRADRNYIK